MKTPTQEFIDWIDLFLIGKESLTPKQLEQLKERLKKLKSSGVEIKDLTEVNFERPKPETLIQYPTFNFKKDE